MDSAALADGSNWSFHHACLFRGCFRGQNWPKLWTTDGRILIAKKYMTFPKTPMFFPGDFDTLDETNNQHAHRKP